MHGHYAEPTALFWGFPLNRDFEVRADLEGAAALRKSSRFALQIEMLPLSTTRNQYHTRNSELGSKVLARCYSEIEIPVAEGDKFAGEFC